MSDYQPATKELSESPQGPITTPRTASGSASGVLLWPIRQGLVPTKRAPHPIALADDVSRLAHVRRMLRLRRGIELDIDAIAQIEKKIHFCQTKREINQAYAPVLPRCLAFKKTVLFRRQYWHVKIDSKPVVFVVDRPTMKIISVWKRPTPEEPSPQL